MNLEQFLIRSQYEGYASRGEGQEEEGADGSKTLSYKNGDFEYLDKYFGFSKFVGNEIVWEKGKYVWGNSYFGWLTTEVENPVPIYKFLKRMLRMTQITWRNRGPNHHEEKEFIYDNSFTGDYTKFSGTEKIFYNGKQVFELKYNGGLLQSRN